MSALDTGNPLAGPSGVAAPTTDADTRPDPLTRLPRAARFALYFVVTFAILSLAQSITGADQLTAENTFRFAVFLALPIGLAGLGGLWAERAGVINIGLEGMMILGTWFGAYGAITWGAWEGVAFGMVGGALGGLLHAVATVSFGVDHIISGVAINLLGVGFTNFLTPVAYPGATRESPPSNPDIARVDLLPFTEDPLRTLSGQGRFLLSDLADLVLALTTNVSLLVIVAVAMFPASWYVLWRTPFGLRLRSVGEDPDAADSLGVKVLGIKYFAVSASGAFAGLGGVTLVYLFSERFQQGQTNGRGYIGLAAMLFGNWRPGGLVAGAGLFGFMDSVRTQVPATGHAVLVVAALAFVVVALRMALLRRFTLAAILVGLGAIFWWWYQSTDSLPREITPYFPHITTLLVLIFAAQRLRMPAANGRIYRRGGR